MNAFIKNKPTTIDYNDLKKRRMLRSNARRSKINAFNNRFNNKK
jgi:hypothetical protein